MESLATVLAAKIWHWWIAWPLFASAVLVVALLGVGYLVKVVRPRYPSRR